MATYHTVDGQPYAVTAGTDVTVTDADGLVLSVTAGGQGSFVGNGGDVEVTGNHHFMQVKGGFSVGGGGGGGGGEPFDGNLNANLTIGKGATGTKAEWTVHLGSLTSQGCLEESTTGYGCCVGVKPSRDAHELVDDINTESSLGLIVEAVYVSETELKLVARRPGEYANGYSISANDAGEPGVESPCFGRGSVPRTVDGRTEMPATAYNATLNGERMLAATDVDAVPRLYSMNPVSSDGVRRKLAEKASVADDNVFAGANTFESCSRFVGQASFNSPVMANGGIEFRNTTDRLNTDSNGTLYWGCHNLNDVGDVRRDGDNVFTRENTFNENVQFYDSVGFYGAGNIVFGSQYSCSPSITSYGTIDAMTDVSFHGSAYFYGRTYFNCGLNSSDVTLNYRYSHLYNYSLYNYQGRLYWNGDRVWTARDMGSTGDYAKLNDANAFTGSNIFHNLSVNGVLYFPESESISSCTDLYKHGDDLYWRTTKLNGGGGGGGGDVYTDRNNMFTGYNTFSSDTSFTGANTYFNSCTTFNGLATFSNTVQVETELSFSSRSSKHSGNYLYNYNDDLYWGDTKLNCGGGGGGGDVYTHRANGFYCVNRFYEELQAFQGVYIPRCLGDRRAEYSLANHNGDLYWGYTKINGGGGGGDVTADGDNVFNGSNTFNGDASFHSGAILHDHGSQFGDGVLYNHNGDLYWGDTKINGGDGARLDCDNTFTGQNTFDGSAFFTTPPHLQSGMYLDCSSCGIYMLHRCDDDLYWGDTKLNGGGCGDVYADGDNVFTGSNTFSSYTYFDSDANFNSSAHFSSTPYLPNGLYLGCEDTVKLANGGDGHLYFGDTRLNSALHNPATTGGTVEITIGDKSLVLDCAKLQTLINLLEA